MFGGYEGGWDPAPFLNPTNAAYKFPTATYKSKSGKDFMDFRAWADGLNQDERNDQLRGIYLSAKMMKFHPAITKDLKKTYGLVASAALRAMTPAAKWAVKRLFHPYNAAKRAVAGDIAAYKAKMGIAPRKGLAGRIDYWNQLVDLDMEDARMMSALTGTNRDVISKNAAFKNDGVWAATTYAAYKDAMKKRLKAQLAARQDMIDKMDPDEYKAYRHRVKALKDAKAATKAKRDALRAAWRANADVGFTKLDASQFAPNYADLAKAAITARKYTDVSAADIQDYISGRPAKSLLSAYTSGLKDWEKRTNTVVHPTFGDVAYEGPSLTSRGPMSWGSKALAAQQAAAATADANEAQKDQGMNVEQQ